MQSVNPPRGLDRMFQNLVVFCVTMVFTTTLAEAEQLRVLTSLSVISQDGNSSEPEEVEFASWIDSDSIVYCTQKGRLACRRIREQEDSWSKEGNYKPKQIRVDLVGKRIAISCAENDSKEVFSLDSIFRVYDGRTGTIVFQAKEPLFAKQDSENPSLAEITQHIFLLEDFAFHPINGSLLICSVAFSYGPNAFVLNGDYRGVEARIQVDGSLRGICFSSDGKRLVTHGVSNSEHTSEFLCVSELSTGKDIVHRGKRDLEKPQSIHYGIGPSYITRLEHDGDDLLVGAVNGGCWSDGSYFVERISTGNKQVLESQANSCEMDVDFDKKRIVVCKSHTSISLVNLQLETITSLDYTTQKGIRHLEFSPDGSKLLVIGDGLIKILAIDP